MELTMKKYLAASITLTALTIAASAPAAHAQFTTLSEAFDNVSALLTTGGWAATNLSTPPPFTGANTQLWRQGDPTLTASEDFLSSGGDPSTNPAGYAYADFQSTRGNNLAAAGTISNWFITPVLDFSLGGVLSFFSRTTLGNSRAEFLEVRVSTSGASTNVGTSAASVGDFTTLLLTVGDLDELNTYPGINEDEWLEFGANIAALGSTGRIGFRYFATDGGANGTQGQFVGIDTFDYVAVPEPSAALGTLVLGGIAVGLRRRKNA
jgi:hypothetical protein